MGSSHTPCPRLAEPLCPDQLTQPQLGATPVAFWVWGIPGWIPLTLFLHQKHWPCLFISRPFLSFWSSLHLAGASLASASRSTPSMAKWVQREQRPYPPWGLSPGDHSDYVQLNKDARKPHGVVATLGLTKLN